MSVVLVGAASLYPLDDDYLSNRRDTKCREVFSELGPAQLLGGLGVAVVSQ